MADQSRGVITQAHKIARVLRVGQAAIVQKEMSQEKRMATIIGWDPGQMVILTMPIGGPMAGALSCQNAILVRFLYLGSVYGFASSVLEVHKERNLLLIAWPKRLERVGLTQEQRFELRLDLLMSASADGQNFGPQREATLIDLSQGGCRICLPGSREYWDEFPTGVLARIDFPDPANGSPQPILARVRNANKTGDDLEMGLMFEAGQEEILRGIRSSLLPKLLTQNPQAFSASPAQKKTAAAAKVELAPPRGEAAPEKAPAKTAAPAAQAPAQQAIPAGERVDPGGRLSLNEVTIDKVIEVLGVTSISGSVVAVTRCREFVRDWVERKGWKGATERRNVLLRHIKNIPGLEIK